MHHCVGGACGLLRAACFPGSCVVLCGAVVLLSDGEVQCSAVLGALVACSGLPAFRGLLLCGVVWRCDPLCRWCSVVLCWGRWWLVPDCLLSGVLCGAVSVLGCMCSGLHVFCELVSGMLWWCVVL